eukprot:Sspe_Gene.84199::Locus_55269_Transcript_1_1_Confidence_1.000_Length_2245::g.84199::m.84199
MKGAVVGLLVVLLAHCGECAGLQLACKEPNDLAAILRKSTGKSLPCLPSLDAAVSAAGQGDRVLSLMPTVLSSEVIAGAAKKGLSLYAELPSGTTATVKLERVVVAKGGVAMGLNELTILSPHGIEYADLTQYNGTVLLHLAKVAGYDVAVDGLPKDAKPFLVSTTLGGTVQAYLAAGQISMLVTQRFAPVERWGKVVDFLFGAGTAPLVVPQVTPAYPRTSPLPPDAIEDTAIRGVEWYVKSGFLQDAKTTLVLAELRKQGVVGPLFLNSTTSGTGRMGVLEGFSTYIGKGGKQPASINLRNDCITESSMAFAMRSVLRGGNASHAAVSRNLLNYAWFHGGFSQPWVPGLGDSLGSTFGLLGWDSATPVSYASFYKDDDARGILAGLLTAGLLHDDRWDTVLTTAMLANLRLTGTNGFGPSSARFPSIVKDGWRATYNSAPAPYYSPHYMAYLWAAYFAAYNQTGYRPFFDRSYAAVRIMMEGYPSKWVPTSNGITVQRARMILPLAWLVRVEDSALHRSWLDTIVEGLLARQQPCGGFMEEVSASGWGGTTRVPNNDDYGTFEAPLNQNNTDPVTDLLYTQNFALIGLIEAAAATGNPRYKEALDKLLDYMVRIQARSTAHPELDGGYFRGFDFDKWEVWASDADAGWGAWSMETGWIQSWITTSLGLVTKNLSAWDVISRNVRLADDAAEWIPFFFPSSP